MKAPVRIDVARPTHPDGSAASPRISKSNRELKFTALKELSMEPSKNLPTPPKNIPPRPGAASTPTIVDDAKDLATRVAGQARDAVTDQLDDKQKKSAGEIDKVATALRHTSKDLGDSVAAPYVEKAAALLDRVSGSVRGASLRDTLRATERFAQRDPLLFIGGAFVIGLVAARFLKSSARAADEGEEPLLLESGHAGSAASNGNGSVADRMMGPDENRGRDGH
jgi:hypothetical protein